MLCGRANSRSKQMLHVRLFRSTLRCAPAVISKESPHHCCTRAVDLPSAEEKEFSPPSAANTVVPTAGLRKVSSNGTMWHEFDMGLGPSYYLKTGGQYRFKWNVSVFER
ncbi:hypothetical protein M9H77_21557 [Catharanthus roseus]|uniref:Uncharacterized protein n=1 Tax=Catharanthus roseus TaxID=4058 RepID=A0ACC0APZ4_CATRO|nr:hypothetical protein M9H77_21557 [Catharanthus roseus]